MRQPAWRFGETISGGSGATVVAETVGNRDDAAGHRVPIGVTIVSALVAVTGCLWIVWSALVLPAEGSILAAMSPAIGAALLLLAAGLWRRHWVAWGLTNVGLLGVIWWEFLHADVTNLSSLPLLQLGMLTYLIYRQDLFIGASQVT